MQNAQQQRQMAEKLRNDIRFQREKANTSNRVVHDATIHNFNVLPNMIINQLSMSNGGMSGERTHTLEDDETTLSGSTPFPWLHERHRQHRYLGGVEQSTGIEMDFITKYIDFIFPALLPFYRPSLFETGRAWLLLLLGTNKIAYHSIVGLSCYFFTLALTEVSGGEMHEECKQLRWEEVEQQTNKCFDSIRTDVIAMDLDSTGQASGKLQKVEMMGSIIQVLMFEITLGKLSPSNPHLLAAFALFKEIMSCPGQSHQSEDQSRLTSVLLETGPPSWTQPELGKHIWSPIQASFRFCAGVLIFLDVVASTTLRSAPGLLDHHVDILIQPDDGNSAVSEAEVRLSNIIGCRNWVIRSISAISALDSWKQQQSQPYRLSIDELRRASAIADDLRNGIVELQKGSTPSVDQYTPFNLQPSPATSAIPTLIWAHAAGLYLFVVVSGWKPSDTVVRTHVTETIKLLQIVPAYQRRAFAWPICVAGCLALESEEPSFLALFTNQGKIYTTGALDDTRQILELVWQTRTTLDASAWNLASCFNILGSPTLLV